MPELERHGRASGSRRDENGDAASVSMRVGSAGALCLLAALSPFLAGWRSALVGLVPLGCAIWLVAKLPWPLSARLATSVAAVVATIALFVGLLLLVLTYSSYD